MAHHNNYRSPFGDTTYTKVFVGGLAWETASDVLREYFEQFGEILEAVIITDKSTGKSKGYGFVTFREPESATRACADPRPVIDGRRANCNIAALGAPPGRNQIGKTEGGPIVPQAVSLSSSSSSFSGVAGPLISPLQPASQIIYPHYGYMAYSPQYGYHQTIYSNLHLQQAQYYNQLYGGIGTSSAGVGNYPYNFGGYYSMEASKRPISTNQTQVVYYPTTSTQLEGSFSYPQIPLRFPPTNIIPSSSDAQTGRQTSSETEAGAATSENPNVIRKLNVD